MIGCKCPSLFPRRRKSAATSSILAISGALIGAWGGEARADEPQPLIVKLPKDQLHCRRQARWILLRRQTAQGRIRQVAGPRAIAAGRNGRSQDHQSGSHGPSSQAAGGFAARAAVN